jgi:4-hydroxybenzoate polyprenyltransferase
VLAVLQLQNLMKGKRSNVKQAKEFFETIKISHTIFSMPFAVFAVFFSLQSVGSKDFFWILQKFILVVCCVFCARSWAMGFNRIVDEAIDKKNLRTNSRALPANRISKKNIWFLSSLFASLFVFFSFQLSFLAGFLSVPVLIFLAGYSYTKRFTWLCHFWLGLSLGIAPLAVWVALRETFPEQLIFLSVAILFWVSGFDILYSLQDEEFDKKENLNSIPARFGYKKSVLFSQICHVLSTFSFLAFGFLSGMGHFYFFGLLLLVVLLAWQHVTILKFGLSKIDLAFFTLNGWFSLVFLFFSTIDIFRYHIFNVIF